MYRAKTYKIQISIICVLICFAMLFIHMSPYFLFTDESIITQSARTISEELKPVPACRGTNNSFVVMKVRKLIMKINVSLLVGPSF